MKELISTMMLSLIATMGWAQTKTWNNIVTGYSNVPFVKVTKVVLNADSTEVFMHFDMPSQAAGQEGPMAVKSQLQADGKTYEAKRAIGLKLGQPIKIPQDGKVDFSLVFDALPASTWKISISDPGMWLVNAVRDADAIPAGITDTYWRNTQTGDWLIGFTQHHVIYNNKVWDILNQTEQKGTYLLTLNDGLTIKVGKLKKGIRPITIGREKAIACSPITTDALPDYPTKDMRKGFVDNGYKAGDSVTIIGWLKDMPEQAWKKGNEFSVGVFNMFKVDEENAYTKMDSLGRFTIKMPLLNTSQVNLDWGRISKITVLEPGKTYFFLSDFANGQTLWMGDDVRLQNELRAHPYEWPSVRAREDEQGKLDAMNFKHRTDSARAACMALLDETIKQTPNISQRYIDFLEGFYHTLQGESMMQARFAANNMELPQQYMDYVGKEIWAKAAQPYTLYRDFSWFMRDYMDQVIRMRPQDGLENMNRVITNMEKQGVATLTADERQALQQYPSRLKQLQDTIQKVKDNEKIQALINAFNSHENTKKIEALVTRLGEPYQEELVMLNFSDNLALLDSVGSNQVLRDIYLARDLYTRINVMRKPLNPAYIKFAEEHIKMPAALEQVKTLNDKYVAIENMDMSKLAKLNKGADVEGMSDGEKMLRKICEPYKGKLILLDIWGTWCGPCKQLLSHSQEEYKRLKDFDLVYLYLCNDSSDESWKNVIKEYKVVGPNVVHYNLPKEQQSAIEHYLNVHSFPTYKLIDREGNVLDLDVSAHDLEGLAKLLEKIK